MDIGRTNQHELAVGRNTSESDLPASQTEALLGSGEPHLKHTCSHISELLLVIPQEINDYAGLATRYFERHDQMCLT